MIAQAALAEVIARTRDEIAAIDAGDLDALARATRAKLAAIEPLRSVDPATLAAGPAQETLATAAALNREAAQRVNVARARIDRRLHALARAIGRPAPMAYGPDGRPAARMLRP